MSRILDKPIGTREFAELLETETYNDAAYSTDAQLKKHWQEDLSEGSQFLWHD
jgi:hypothetical protein